MPYQPVNFLQAEAKPYGPHGLLESAIEGYKASRMPAQMKREEQRQAELVQKLQHGNYKAGLENEHLPEKLEDEKILRQIETRYAGPKAESELQKTNLGNRHQEMVNSIMEKYGVDEAEANLALKHAQAEEAKSKAKYAHTAHLTPQERNVAAMIGYDKLRTPEGQRLVAALNRVPESELSDQSERRAALPEGSKSMAHWPEHAKADEIKAQREELKTIQSAKVLKAGIQDARKILEEYPNMYKSFGLILADPDNEQKFSRLLGGLTDERERSAAIQFRKITQKIVNKNAEALGGRSTNVRYKGLQQEKPSIYNTRQGNEYVFDEIEQEINPTLEREPALRAAYGEYALPPHLNYEHKESANLVGGEQEKERLGKKPTIQEALNRNKPKQEGGSNALIEIEVNGEIYDVPVNEVDAFMIARKDQNPKIKLGAPK